MIEILLSPLVSLIATNEENTFNASTFLLFTFTFKPSKEIFADLKGMESEETTLMKELFSND